MTLIVDREKIADLCHKQWTGWMEYLFSRCKEDTEITSPAGYAYKTTKNGDLIIPKEWVERWKRQMETDYKNLSEDEKNIDRKEADKYIDAFVPKYHNLEDSY